MAKIKIVREITYIYDSPEIAAKDMATWNLDANTTTRFGEGKKVTSRIILNREIK